MKKKSSYKNYILSDSQICPSKEQLQVKFINCYLREIISFTTKKIDIRDWGQSSKVNEVLNPCHGISYF